MARITRITFPAEVEPLAYFREQEKPVKRKKQRTKKR
jgi:hypothetical protein